jgi:hypothetical protein
MEAQMDAIQKQVDALIPQYTSGLLTLREFVNAITLLGMNLPPLEVGEIDENTGLVYKG